ncbi:DUF192 domain-containing protein [Candidatus Kaiserbacteria bacterium]|nr:DUF192 domain-containing protein [Candidatus Kaiserbacteria bacterium]
MKIAERIVMVALALALIGAAGWFYFAVHARETDLREAVARGDFNRPEKSNEVTDPSDWRTIYPNTVGLTIGSTSVEASVADSLPERIKGLSDTPYLPPNVVKLFAFGAAGEHSIWMKDMNYPLDIIWAAQDGTIVHFEQNVSPDTYPQAFSSPTPAWFVVEANAGFVAEHNVKIGDEVTLPIAAEQAENMMHTPEIDKAAQ